MKKVLLFAIAVSAAFFLSCSADNATSYESGEGAVWEALGEQSPDRKAPTEGGSGVTPPGGGGGGGSCTITVPGSSDQCVDEGDNGMTEAVCDQMMGMGEWSEDPC